MKIVRFRYKGDKVLLGIVDGEYVYEIEDINKEPKGQSYKLSEIEYEVPIRPTAIFCTLVNTPRMIGVKSKEEAKELLGSPKFFIKLPYIVTPHRGTVISPRSGIRPEVEIAVIISKRLRKVSSRHEINDAILGYSVFNDVTAPREAKGDIYTAYRRDPADGKIKKMSIRGAHFRNKNRDTFAPLGPWIVTREEVPDVLSLRMRSYYDNQIVQDGYSSEFVFDIEEIIMELSRIVTVPENSIVTTGSIGYLDSEDPSEYCLEAKDTVMRVEVEKIGILENYVKVE
ncbi:MAG: fumarylacetoacetate hydrolase family protein [Sulfolobaceae archaeon]